MALVMVSQGRLAEAETALTAYLQSEPDDLDALVARAGLLLALPDHSRVPLAVTDLKTVLAKRPLDREATFQFGRALANKGNCRQQLRF